MPVVKKQLVKEGSIPVSLELLKAKEYQSMLLVAAQLLCHLSGVLEYVSILVDNGAIPVLVKLWEDSSDAEVWVYYW